MEFWRIYRLLYAKRWLIVAVILIAAAVILVGTAIQAQKRDYEAIAILQPQNNTLPDVIARTTEGGGAPNPGPAATAPDSPSNVSDVIMILRSSNDLYNKTAGLLREDEGLRVVDVQRILDRNAYFASVDNDIQTQANRMVKKSDMTQAEANTWIAAKKQEARTLTVNQLARGRDASGTFASAGLKLTEDEITDLIREKMSFDTVLGPLSTDTTPQIADQIQVSGKFSREAESVLYVNLLCVEFLDFYTNQKTSSINARIAQLNELLDAAKTKLRKARQDETEFRQASGVSLTAAADATINRAQSLQNQRDEAERELYGADAAVTALQAALQSTRTTRTEILPPEENPEVRSLRSQVDEANIAFQTVVQSNEGAVNNEKYITAHARLLEAKNQLDQALARQYTTTTPTAGIDDLQSKLNAAIVQRGEAQQHLKVAESQIAAQHAEMASLPAAENKLADLRREIALDEQNVRELETTVNREMEYGVEHGRAGTIDIVSAAHPTPVISRLAMQRWKLIIYGMALALFFGIVLVVAIDALDNSVRTAEDVEKLTGLPVAGIIPEHLPDPVRSPRVALLEPMSAATEAYRMLRTDLLFTAADKPFRSLLTATAKPGQGATTTLCNLAIVLAQSGKRVILVDADLRHPKLNRIFQTSNDIGLTTVLTDRCEIEDALLPTEVENLTLLPAGPFVLTPSEMLGSTRMQALHEQLKSIADFVLFDTPAAIAYSDTAILSSFLDATLLIVRAESIPRGTENQVMAMLLKARANLIGSVLNGVAPERVDSVHYHDAYYPALAAVSPSYRDDKQRHPAPAEHSGIPAYQDRNGILENDDDLAIALPETAGQGRNNITTAVVPVPAGGSDPSDTQATANGASEAARSGVPIAHTRDAPRRPPHAQSEMPSRGSGVSPFAASVASPPSIDAANGSARGGVGKKHQAFHAKTILMVVVAGLALGALLLVLNNASSVK